MLMAWRESITGSVAVRLFPLIAVSSIMAFVVVPVSDSPYAWIAFHALTAFLATIASAVAITRNREFSSLSNWLQFAGFFFIVMRHIASAIEGFLVVYGAGILEGGNEILAIPLELAVLGGLFLVSEIANRRPVTISHRNALVLSAVAVLASFFLYAFLWVFFQLDVGNAARISLDLSIIAMVLLLGAGALALHHKKHRTTSEVARVLTIYWLYGLASFAILFSFLYPSLFWINAPTLQVITLIQISMTVALPTVERMQLRLRSTYTFIAMIGIIALLPFLFILVGEELLPGVRFYSFEVFLLSHTGAAILSGGIAILLYAFSRRQPLRLHYPLIFLFTSWTTIEIGLIVASLTRLPITINQTLVPYITGSFASFFLLGWMVFELRRPQDIPKPQQLRLWSIIAIAGLVVIITFGERLQLFLQSASTTVSGNPTDRIILMWFNIVLMFLFTLTGFLMLERFKTRITVESISFGYLTLWILPSLLKSITLQWTLGWWIGEFFLLAGLLFGPVILGIAYLQVLGRAETLRRQASLYSDLLIHDIGNFHQIIQGSLDLLEMEGATPKIKAQAREQAQAGLTRAYHLIRNVRQLARIVETREEDTGPVDLVECLGQAFELVIEVTQSRKIKLEIQYEERQYLVLATDLLKDAFYNLLKNAIDYSPEEKRIIIDIEPYQYQGVDCWAVRITDHGRGIKSELKDRLFQRFLKGAEGIGLGLSVVWTIIEAFKGTIIVEDRIPDDYTKGTVFIVILPAAKIESSSSLSYGS